MLLAEHKHSQIAFQAHHEHAVASATCNLPQAKHDPENNLSLIQTQTTDKCSAVSLTTCLWSGFQASDSQLIHCAAASNLVNSYDGLVGGLAFPFD